MQNQDDSGLPDESQVRALYTKLLDSWNDNNAAAYAGFFIDDANVIGFDGSNMNGKTEIFQQINDIFNHHKVASYVSIVREVRTLGPGTLVLRGVAGMVPPGRDQINPSVNAIQTLVAVKQKGEFKIALFQNTPAAFHGRPELNKQLTEELQQVFEASNKSGDQD